LLSKDHEALAQGLDIPAKEDDDTCRCRTLRRSTAAPYQAQCGRACPAAMMELKTVAEIAAAARTSRTG